MWGGGGGSWVGGAPQKDPTILIHLISDHLEWKVHLLTELYKTDLDRIHYRICGDDYDKPCLIGKLSQ